MDETRSAFEHPEVRAKATATDPLLDRISLRDHIVEVEIGAFQVERDVTQRLKFNVVVEVQPVSGDPADDVDRILSYDRITEAIAYELKAERLNLLETLAERVADRILIEPQPERVFVRIEKLDRGPGALGVEIVRGREDITRVADEEQIPRPSILYLSNAALASPHIAGWIDQLSNDGAPWIICVEAHDGLAPKVQSASNQLHIDLLSVEQNAWALASLEPRCSVVATRTELDWSIKNDQISIWAPSKIVLDSTEAVQQNAVGGAGLAMWFAREMNASQILSVGESLPEDSQIDTINVSIETVVLSSLANRA